MLMLLVMIVFVATVTKLCKVLENSGSHRLTSESTGHLCSGS